jgi:hypothetical protein
MRTTITRRCGLGFPRGRENYQAAGLPPVAGKLPGGRAPGGRENYQPSGAPGGRENYQPSGRR